VQEGGVVFAASAIDEAARVVARLLADQPDGITVAEARDAWGTTRKFAIPLITRLDETGVTRRRGDLRIAGPRLPQG
jgi:selenocysteine-specific elongation factor